LELVHNGRNLFLLIEKRDEIRAVENKMHRDRGQKIAGVFVESNEDDGQQRERKKAGKVRVNDAEKNCRSPQRDLLRKSPLGPGIENAAKDDFLTDRRNKNGRD